MTLRFFSIALLLFAHLSYGQECGVVYVSPTGASSGTAGTKQTPANLSYGLQLANAQNSLVRLAVGTYVLTQPLSLKSNIVIEGGYLPNEGWAKTNAQVSFLQRTADNVENNPKRLIALKAEGIEKFRLQDISVTVADAPATGISVYGLYINNAKNYTICRCQIQTGKAGDGIDGVNGIDGQAGAAGKNGGLGCKRCDPVTPPYIVTAGAGGNSWSGGVCAGGAGGDGGLRGVGTTCNPFNSGCEVCDTNIISAPNGKNGLPGSGTGAGAGGIGKFGLNYCETNSGLNFAAIFDFLNSCPTSDTTLFRGSDGINGTAGAPGIDGTNGVSAFSNGFFVPGDGTSGTDGKNGSGGGGGGGGSSIGGVPTLGVLDNLNSAGAGGGGGGEGGQRGTAGTSGTGAGGSFPLFIWNSGVNGVVKDCLLKPGNAGVAGKGGLGGKSGVGGVGGLGGNDVLMTGNDGSGCEGGAGGNGGKGGDGGKGGNGGNGSPGLAIPLYQDPNGEPILFINQYKELEAKITVKTTGCANTTVNVSTTSNANVINWSVGGINPSGTGPTIQTEYPDKSFNTLAILVDGIPFIYTDFVYVYRPYQQPVIIADKQAVCAGGTVNFSTNTPADSYKWTFNGANPNNFVGQNPGNITFNTPGTYYAQLQTQTCCGDSKIDTFIVYVIEQPTPILPAQDTICVTDPRPLLNAQSLPGGSYQWSLNGNNLPGANTPTLQTQEAGTYKVTLTYPGGCSGSAEFKLTILDSLIVELGTDVTVCFDEAPPLLNAGNPGCTYAWTRNGQLVSQSQFLQTTLPGLYRVVVTNPHGCVGTDKMRLKKSSPIVALGSDITVCADGLNNILDGSPIGAIYEWRLNGQVVAQTRYYNVSNSGTVTVAVTDTLGCIARDTLVVTVAPTLNAAINAPTTTNVGTPVAFTDASTPTPLNRYWNFGDGNVSTQGNPTHTYTQPGLKPVFLIVRNALCADTAYHTIDVRLNCATVGVGADFTFTPDTLVLNTQSAVRFFNNSTNATTFYWDFGNGNTSFDTAPTQAYADTGMYVVKLVASNYNCADSITKKVYVERINTVSVEEELQANISIYPNPATEHLYINTLNNLAHYQLRILDAKGMLTYQTKWEGAHTLSIATHGWVPGVYVCILQSNDGKQFIHKQIIR